MDVDNSGDGAQEQASFRSWLATHLRAVEIVDDPTVDYVESVASGAVGRGGAAVEEAVDVLLALLAEGATGQEVAVQRLVRDIMERAAHFV